MTTFDEFIESTSLFMSGFSSRQEQYTYLTSNLAVDGLSVTVDDPSIVSSGATIEIGSELLWVKSVDESTSTVTFAPFGRGYRGTTAAAHTQNDRVTIAPMVPRHLVEQAVNDSIRGVYPQVHGVSTTTFTYVGARTTYALPAGAVHVLSVSWDSVGPTLEWEPVRRWRVEPNANTTDFNTGASLSIYDTIIPGRTVNVVYTHQPIALGAGDAFTDSGLRDAAQDLVRFGAAYRLAPWFEAGQLAGNDAEANYMAGLGRGSSGSQTGRFLLQMYQLRLIEEAAALQDLYPTRSHYTR